MRCVYHREKICCARISIQRKCCAHNFQMIQESIFLTQKKYSVRNKLFNVHSTNKIYIAQTQPKKKKQAYTKHSGIRNEISEFLITCWFGCSPAMMPAPPVSLSIHKKMEQILPIQSWNRNHTTLLLSNCLGKSINSWNFPHRSLLGHLRDKSCRLGKVWKLQKLYVERWNSLLGLSTFWISWRIWNCFYF